MTQAEGIAQIRDYIEMSLKMLVDDESQVKVTVRQGEQTVVYHISAAQNDLGKVIGKQGRNITALRTLLNAYVVKHKLRAVIDLAE